MVLARVDATIWFINGKQNPIFTFQKTPFISDSSYIHTFLPPVAKTPFLCGRKWKQRHRMVLRRRTWKDHDFTERKVWWAEPFLSSERKSKFFCLFSPDSILAFIGWSASAGAKKHLFSSSRSFIPAVLTCPSHVLQLCSFYSPQVCVLMQ